MCSRSRSTTRAAFGPGSGVINRGSFACVNASVLVDSLGIQRLYTRSGLAELGTSYSAWLNSQRARIEVEARSWPAEAATHRGLGSHPQIIYWRRASYQDE